MMTRYVMKHLKYGFFFLFLALFNTGCTDEICTAAELTEALQTANSGHTVEIGTCVIHATDTFVIQPGVTVKGVSSSDSVIQMKGGTLPVFKLIPGKHSPTLSNIKIDTDTYSIAVWVEEGEGTATIENTEIKANRGYGLGAERVEALNLSNVVLNGPVEEDDYAKFKYYSGDPTKDELGNNSGPDDVATNGLLINKVDNVNLTDVDISGFAGFGAFFATSKTQWSGGQVVDNLGVGVRITGGTAKINGLTFCRTMGGNDDDKSGGGEGFWGLPAYNVLSDNHADIETYECEFCNSHDFGAVHLSSGSVTHENSRVSGNRSSGIWAQQSEIIKITGSGSSIESNSLAGIVLIGNSYAAIEDIENISNTAEGTRVIGETQDKGMADGIHILRPESQGEVLLKNIELTNNKRIGILIETEENSGKILLEGQININGIEDQRGAHVQGEGNHTTGLDNINKDAITALNDEEAGDINLSVTSDIENVEIPEFNLITNIWDTLN